MTLFQPQLLLVQGKNDNYFLHATTYLDRIDIKTNGQSIPDKPNKNGVLKIKLYALQEQNLADIDTKYLNPIVHVIDLGNFEESGVKEVQASLYIEYPGTSSSRSNKPKRRKAGSSNSTRPKTGKKSRPNKTTTV